MKNALKLPPELPLDVQIEELRSRLNALIDAKAEQEAKLYGLPAPVTRRGIELHAMGCPCGQYLKMVQK